MPTITLKTEIRAKRFIVFDLSRSIDLHKISVSHTSEEAIAGKTSGLIGLNETVTWKAKHFGIYQKLTSKITEFDPPYYFADEMVEGAFKSFKHEHHFFNLENGTLLMDIFVYTSPFGILGKVADKLFLKKHMTNFLKKRNLALKEVAESGEYVGILTEKMNKINSQS